MILESAEMSDDACSDSSDSVWRGSYRSDAQTRHSLRLRPKGLSDFAKALPIRVVARAIRKGIAFSRSLSDRGVFTVVGDLRVYA